MAFRGGLRPRWGQQGPQPPLSEHEVINPGRPPGCVPGLPWDADSPPPGQVAFRSLARRAAQRMLKPDRRLVKHKPVHTLRLLVSFRVGDQPLSRGPEKHEAHPGVPTPHRARGPPLDFPLPKARAQWCPGSSLGTWVTWSGSVSIHVTSAPWGRETRRSQPPPESISFASLKRLLPKTSPKACFVLNR